MTSKREQYIGWDAYFMALAAVASFRSKDPSTQNGACIVNPLNRNILSIGYNGFPDNCDDDEFPWGRDGNEEDTKYPYAEHAERNAIYNASKNGIKLEGSYLYLYSEKGYYPCNDCCRGIIRVGIKKVITYNLISENTDKYNWEPTKRMFKANSIEVVAIRNFVKNDFKLMSDKMFNISSAVI